MIIVHKLNPDTLENFKLMELMNCLVLVTCEYSKKK